MFDVLKGYFFRSKPHALIFRTSALHSFHLPHIPNLTSQISTLLQRFNPLHHRGMRVVQEHIKRMG